MLARLFARFAVSWDLLEVLRIVMSLSLSCRSERVVEVAVLDFTILGEGIESRLPDGNHLFNNVP